MEENFIPSFKEKKQEKYFFKDGQWISCGESEVNDLWFVWVESKGAVKYIDDEGFLVFGFNEVAKQD